METTIRAKFSKGVIEPLEKMELEEGTEINITVSILPKTENTLKSLRDTVGAWKGTIDSKELKRNIYSDRLIKTRSEAKL